MKKYLVIASIAALVGITAGSVSAHEGVKPTIKCNEVSSNFTKFPKGEHTITYAVTVNGTTTDVTSKFSGKEGTATADISSLTTATGPLEISAQASWTDDGGGKSEVAKTTLTCHDKPVITQPNETPKDTPKETTPETTTPQAPVTPVVPDYTQNQEVFEGK